MTIKLKLWVTCPEKVCEGNPDEYGYALTPMEECKRCSWCNSIKPTYMYCEYLDAEDSS